MKNKLYLIIITSVIVLGLTIPKTSHFHDLKFNNSNHEPGLQLPEFYKGMAVIKLKSGTVNCQLSTVNWNVASLNKLNASFQVQSINRAFKYNPKKLKACLPDLSRIYRIRFPENVDVFEVVRAFENDPNIEYAEPVARNRLVQIPDDPMYGDCQHLPQILAQEAWAIHIGEDGTEVVIVAIDDTGADWDHPDLVENLWQNLGEDADGDGHVLELIGDQWIFDPDDENGIDDDGNGYVDDFIGWNFETHDNDPQPNPSSAVGDHGSHCSGIAVGRTNNGEGISSISWNISLMPLQADSASNTVFYGYDAMIYAAENGADVISNSWSSPFFSQARQEVIDYVTGLGSIVVAAASNDDNEVLAYPASYHDVISVAAVTNHDIKASFSSYGIGVDVSAPGVGILSTVLDGEYGYKGGTSMSTPMVAGLLGLIKSYHPEWENDQIITQMIGTAEDIDDLNPSFVNMLGSGRIHAYHALNETAVSTPQELRLLFSDCDFVDEDGDGMIEPGETFYFNINMRNFAVGAFAENATFTLSTNDSSLIIHDSVATASIPGDDFFELEEAFLVEVPESITPHETEFTVTVNSNIEITFGEQFSFKTLIAPSGILVFRGPGSGLAYSGPYIRDFFLDQGYDVVYTSSFPSSFSGFDAVFLSFGNYGSVLADGTIITQSMIEVITEYLEGGGNLYEDCGSFFGSMVYFEYPNTGAMMELFSVAEVETPLISNTISQLEGLNGSIAEGIGFEGSSQSPNYYIDIMTPDENGTELFEEENYGVVGIQGIGEYGQRTICFSYALDKLTDGEHPNTREELLTRIAEFFGLIVSVEETGKEDLIVTAYPNPFLESVTVRYQIKDKRYQISDLYLNVEIFDCGGNLVYKRMDMIGDLGENEIVWDASGMPAGVYFVHLLVGGEKVVRKIVKY